MPIQFKKGNENEMSKCCTEYILYIDTQKHAARFVKDDTELEQFDLDIAHSAECYVQDKYNIGNAPLWVVHNDLSGHLNIGGAIAAIFDRITGEVNVWNSGWEKAGTDFSEIKKFVYGIIKSEKHTGNTGGYIL